MSEVNPYESPTNRPASESQLRITHVVAAMTTAVLAAIFLQAASFSLPLVYERYWPGVSEWAKFASTVAGSICAGLVLLRFPKLGWVSAAIAGPCIAFPFSVAFGTLIAIAKFYMPALR